jgi:hypothetical protein
VKGPRNRNSALENENSRIKWSPGITKPSSESFSAFLLLPWRNVKEAEVKK